MSSQNQKRLLDQVRDIMRLNHYSIHTERTYSDWIKRYVQFHRINSREDMQSGDKRRPGRKEDEHSRRPDS
ncbi:MAG: phage integrase N-terminal SAM-like domain-containing protein [Deltaproteobacteria bacterium]|nr:phage integrase N-terminal SAM-like domain-containing protein [Deltaproteobacteria bacterium]